MKKLIVVMSLAALACGPSYADEKKSAVQLAAAAKLAENFGTLRGAIKPDDKYIYLTVKILQQWLPPKIEQVVTDNLPQQPTTSAPATTSPKLPPIVWEIAPETGGEIDNVMTGSTGPQRQKQPDKPESTPHPPELTVARAEIPNSIESLFGASGVTTRDYSASTLPGN